MEFGLNKVYISYSGGKDSTVLSHIAKSMYPNILHLFANTTNEYPETLKHIRWESEENGTNIITVFPKDIHVCFVVLEFSLNQTDTIAIKN